MAQGLVAFVSAIPAGAQSSILKGELSYGPYGVGFTSYYTRDSSAQWAPGEVGRPVRVSVWYPADSMTGRPMVYGDYLHYSGPRDFQWLNDTLEASDRTSWRDDLTFPGSDADALRSRLFASRVSARRDATPVAERFPLLLYAGGLGSRGDANAELGEFLASHGYVVATTPQVGASPKDLELSGSPADVLLHIHDLQVARRVASHLSEVDPTRIAIAGHSMGGTVALQLAMQDSAIKAVIGLDASYGMRGEKAKRFGAAMFPDYSPLRVHGALLDLRRDQGVQEASLDTTVFSALTHADRYRISFRRMYHGDFTEWGPVGLALNAPLPPNPDGRTRETGATGNQVAYEMALAFLEKEFRNSEGQLRDKLDELGHGAGVTIVRRAAGR